MRRDDVAQLAGVPAEHVHSATYDDVYAAYMSTAPGVVLALPRLSPTTYWRVGTEYYLDDPQFGPVITVDDLGYDDDGGLYDDRTD